MIFHIFLVTQQYNGIIRVVLAHQRLFVSEFLRNKCEKLEKVRPFFLYSNISRLKFRLPDGSSTISQFPAETPLNEVRQYIEQNVNVPFSNYTLASTVQHRPFTPSDNNTSLRDLGLVPSAILVILPVS